MIDFSKIAEDSYVLYKNGVRVSQIPLTKDELYEQLDKLDISCGEAVFIERFYGKEGNDPIEKGSQD